MTIIDDVPPEWKNYLNNTLKVDKRNGTKVRQINTGRNLEKWRGNGSRPKGWLMFPVPPKLAPDTFLLTTIIKKAQYHFTSIFCEVYQKNQITLVEQQQSGFAHNKKPLNFYQKLDIEDDFDKLNFNDDDVPRFLEERQFFKTDKASFVKADNDVKELIISIATFDTDSTEAQELISYHNALLGRAQNVLNRIQTKQSHAVNLRKEIIDMEWRQFVNQNEYTYGQWDKGHRYVRSNTLRMDRTKLRELMKPSYKWTNDDYAIFDRNLFDVITNGYKSMEEGRKGKG